MMADIVDDLMNDKHEGMDDLLALPVNTVSLFRALLSLREDSKGLINDFTSINGPLVDAMRTSILANSSLGLESLLETPGTFNCLKRDGGGNC